ncbi:hypothetical protein ACFQGE_17950 [Halomicroarcula sp. GCM10025817]
MARAGFGALVSTLSLEREESSAAVDSRDSDGIAEAEVEFHT